MEAWRTGLALPHAELEPTGRPFVLLTIKSDAGELAYPFATEDARALAEELQTLALEAESQSN